MQIKYKRSDLKSSVFIPPQPPLPLRNKGLLIFSTPFDIESAKLLNNKFKVDCFKIAEQEWKLGLQELNIRISIRLDMEDQGIRPRISSLNPMLAEIASLPTIKKVGTPVHMDN